MNLTQDELEAWLEEKGQKAEFASWLHKRRAGDADLATLLQGKPRGVSSKVKGLKGYIDKALTEVGEKFSTLKIVELVNAQLGEEIGDNKDKKTNEGSVRFVLSRHYHGALKSEMDGKNKIFVKFKKTK